MGDETRRDLYEREGDQALPVHNDEVSCQQRFGDRVAETMPVRMELGLRRYGTLLQPFNGRDFMRDAFEELFDLSVYLEGVAAEREAMLELLQDVREGQGGLADLQYRADLLLASMTPKPKPPAPPTYTVEIEHVTFTGLSSDQLFALDINLEDAEREE